MHLPKRAVKNAAVVSVRAVRAGAAAVLLLSPAWLLGPQTVAAMSRTSRPHPRAVAQEQVPTPSTRAHGKHHAEAAGKHKAAPETASSRSKNRRDAEPEGKTKARPGKKHGRHDDEPQDDPVEMKRAKAHAPKGPYRGEPLREIVEVPRSRRSRELAPAKSSRGRHTEPEVADVTPAPRAKITRPASAPKTELAAVAPLKDVPSKKLSTDDFVRAVSGSPAAFSQGESHPDELDETKPIESVVVVKPAAPKPSPVKAQIAAAAPSVPSTAAMLAGNGRIDGFGAEGAPGHRTLARTMAAHRNDPLVVKSAPAEPVAVAPSAEETAEITDEVVKPTVMPAIYSRGGRLVMPAALKGSHEILVHQNTMADAAGLERLRDEDALADAIADGKLKRLPETASLHINDDLPVNHRYARPWTVKFAVDTASGFSSRFGTALQVNSAVRTVSYQLRLMRTNGNAAAVQGETASPHLTGQAIDIAKRGMSNAQLAWMRAYLLPLMQAGKIDVEEEFQQACFHISVYRSYGGGTRRKATTMQTAAVHHAPNRRDDDEE